MYVNKFSSNLNHECFIFMNYLNYTPTTHYHSIYWLLIMSNCFLSCRHLMFPSTILRINACPAEVRSRGVRRVELTPSKFVNCSVTRENTRSFLLEQNDFRTAPVLKIFLVTKPESRGHGIGCENTMMIAFPNLFMASTKICNPAWMGIDLSRT